MYGEKLCSTVICNRPITVGKTRWSSDCSGSPAESATNVMSVL